MKATELREMTDVELNKQLKDLKAELFNLRFHDCDPVFGGAFTGTHTNAERLLGNGLVGEDLDPDLTATLDVAGQGDTGGLDLVAGDPGGLSGGQAPLAIGHFVASGGLTGHAAAMDAAVFDTLR